MRRDDVEARVKRLASECRIVERSSDKGHERTLVAMSPKGEEMASISWFEPSGRVSQESHEGTDIAEKLRAAAEKARPGLEEPSEDHKWDEVELGDPELRQARLVTARDDFDEDEYRGDSPYDGPLNGPARIPGVTFDWAPGYSDRDHGSSARIVARHPDGRALGYLDWDHDGVVGSAHVHPHYQGQGIGLALADDARLHRGQERLAHSSTLSLKGRAYALADKGTLESGSGVPGRDDHYHTRPFNLEDNGSHREYNPQRFVPKDQPPDAREVSITDPTSAAYSEKLKERYLAEGHHLGDGGWSYDSYGESAGHDPEDFKEDDGDHEYGWDEYGDYVGREGSYNQDGYNEEGYNAEGRDEHGYDEEGYDDEGYTEDGIDGNGYQRGDGHEGMSPSDLPEHLYTEDDERGEDYGTALSRLHPEIQQAIKAAGEGEYLPAYSTRERGNRSTHNIGNGDQVYLSREQAMQAAQHPSQPGMDKDVIRAMIHHSELMHDDDDPSHNSWIHKPDHDSDASSPARIVHLPEMDERLHSMLRDGWSHDLDKREPGDVATPTRFSYSHPSGGSGSMTRSGNGWSATANGGGEGEFDQHQMHNNYEQASDWVQKNSAPLPTPSEAAQALGGDWQDHGTFAGIQHQHGYGSIQHLPGGRRGWQSEVAPDDRDHAMGLGQRSMPHATHEQAAQWVQNRLNRNPYDYVNPNFQDTTTGHDVAAFGRNGWGSTDEVATLAHPRGNVTLSRNPNGAGWTGQMTHPDMPDQRPFRMIRPNATPEQAMNWGEDAINRNPFNIDAPEYAKGTGGQYSAGRLRAYHALNLDMAFRSGGSRA